MPGRLALVLTAALAALGGTKAHAVEPEQRAVDYLAREVPAWARQNHCYSCHNNGDGARAIYDARRRGLTVAPVALLDTTAWLAKPEGWDKNGGDGPFSDKKLARIQFAAALLTAVDAGALKTRDPLILAADRLANDQAADGSWRVDDAGAVGSPATYGRPLATLTALQTLRRADPDRYREPIARASRWLAGRPIVSTLDAAVALMATAPNRQGERPRQALSKLKAGQSDDGGWGPYADDPPQVFDTAIAVLALVRLDPNPEIRVMTAKGRAYLLDAQANDGSWTETTRPSGAESYAQRLSTTGWATLALLATRRPDGEL